jgi:hypothetical protein
MSHFTVLVELDEKIDPRDEKAVNARLEVLLAAYDEKTQVAPNKYYPEDLSQVIIDCTETQTSDGGRKTLPPTLERRWNPADGPYGLNEPILRADRQDSVAFEALVTTQQEKYEAWRRQLQTLYTPAEVAAAYNARHKLVPTNDPADPEPWYADAAGVYSWTRYNPKSRWDWYEVGGRWSGFFLAKATANGDLGNPELSAQRPPDSLRRDVLRKGDLDLEALSAEQDKTLRAEWEMAHDTFPDNPQMAARFKAEIYGIAPADTLTDYLERKMPATADLIKTFAFIDADGRWFEKGKMGWWGEASDEDEAAYDQAFRSWWIQMSEQTVIAVVDCHI